jgi:hypothetical protein
MDFSNQEYLEQLSRYLIIIPQKYVDALITLHEKLGSVQIKWVVGGDLAERLRLVKVDLDCLEIITSEHGVEQIFLAVKEFNPQSIRVQTDRLSRDAVVGKDNYPVYAKSRYFEFNLNGVIVKVQGDLQFKVGDWGWGEVFDFEPEYVYVTGKKIAVTPLIVQLEFYRSLGWIDRAKKIEQITKKTL